MKIELGISTFGETTKLENTGKAISHEERLKEIIEEMKLADEVGLDIYAIGEHHREDFAISAPEIVLAAGATVTKNIKLSSAVTVLSSNDPVRVYQQFSTIDNISNGRAEIMVGRGSFIESFPLFGYDLKDYTQLFDEKLDMLLNIQKNEKLTWKGNLTQSIEDTGIYPRAKDMPIWVATGGSTESTIKIAKLGLPITYAIIGGNPMGFKYLINSYRKLGVEYCHNPSVLKVGAHSWGYIDETDEIAAKKYFYPTKQLVDQISKERSHWNELTYEQYLGSIGESGAMFVGSPETVANKIIRMVENLGLDRFMIHLPVGSMEHSDVMRAIRLFGEEVAPVVRKYFENK